MMEVTKLTSAMPAPPPACNDGQRLNSKRIDLGSSDVDRYEGDDCHDENADKAEEALQANDGSLQTLEH